MKLLESEITVILLSYGLAGLPAVMYWAYARPAMSDLMRWTGWCACAIVASAALLDLMA